MDILFSIIYIVGAVIACVVSLIYVDKEQKQLMKEAEEKGIRHGQANSSIVMGIAFFTFSSWIGVVLLLCKKHYRDILFGN